MTLATVSQPPVRSTGPRARRWRFSVDDYLQLHERGIIPEGVRTELIEGEIRVMSPIGSPHISSTLRLIKLLASRVGDRAEVLCQMDVQFGEHTLFLPDIALLRPEPTGYLDHRPEAADVMLIVKVAHSSLRYDRRRKLPIYARFGVPEVWIAALGEQVLDVYRQPQDGRYMDATVRTPSEVVAPLALPDIVIEVGDVLRSEFWGQRRR